MIANGWSYAKGSLLGFLVGFLLFLLISPTLTLKYHDQVWLLFGCMGSGVAAGCGTVRLMNHLIRRRAQRGRRRSAH